MIDRKLERTSRKCVEDILSDMRCRSGGDWIGQCDEDIQDEIKEEWETIVYNHMANYLNKYREKE